MNKEITLLELCDRLKTTLIIKRFLRKNRPTFSVNLQNAWLYEDEKASDYSSCQKAQVTGKDINKLLYAICDKVSGKHIKAGMIRLSGFKVKKDNLSILGVW